MSTSNILDALDRWATLTPDRPAVTFLDGDRACAPMTYSQLHHRAVAIASRLRTQGDASQPVLIACPPGCDFIVAFFACLYARRPAVPVPAPTHAQSGATTVRLRSIIADSGARHALTTENIATALSKEASSRAPELDQVTWLKTTISEAPQTLSQWRRPDTRDRDVAYIQYTSGSTYQPKGVIVRHANIMATLAYLSTLWIKDQSAPVAVSWLPPYHDMGLIVGILLPLFEGFPLYMMSPASFIHRPARWLQAITQYRGTISAAPNFAYDLCVAAIPETQRRALRLSSWIIAVNAAEPIRAATLDSFAQSFAPVGFDRTAFCGGYGLAEATVAVSAQRCRTGPELIRVDTDQLERGRVVPLSASERSTTLVGCGRPDAVAIEDIAIVNPNTLKRCDMDTIGEIWVRGPGIADGYWRNAHATARAFKAWTADSRGPFLRTGDLGFVHDGTVYVTGRWKEVILIRGRNLYPQDLERTAYLVHPSLPLPRCVAFSVTAESEERVILVVECRRTIVPTSALRRLIQRALLDYHDVQAEIVFVKRGTISTTSSGKLQRRLCRDRYLRGQLAEITPSLSSEDINDTHDTHVQARTDGHDRP